MKKIMYVHHGDIKGGAPMSLRFLLDKIDNEKYETLVVCRVNEQDAAYFSGPNTKVIVEKKIKPFHGSTVSGIDFKQVGYNFYYALPTFFAMKKIVRENKPDVVHLNSTCLFMCAKAVKAVDKNIRVICHIREPLLPNIWGEILKIMSNRYCDQFVAIDEYDRDSVDPQNKKTKVIYNFVDFAKFNWNISKNVIRNELNLKDETVIFLVLARISAENGILELIKMWMERIQDGHSKLVVVGEIAGREEVYTAKCHEYADKTENIHIMPFRADTVDVISSSDVMVCSFTRPHFARMIVEGAAMKKPSLSHYIDGPKELIVDNNTGMFYVDEDQLAERVKMLTYNIELRKQLGENAYVRAQKLFNADINADKTFALYDYGDA